MKTKTTQRKLRPLSDISDILQPGVTHYNIELEVLSPEQVEIPASMFLPREYPDPMSFLAPLQLTRGNYSYRWKWNSLPTAKVIPLLQDYIIESHTPAHFHLKRDFPQRDLLIDILLLSGRFPCMVCNEVTIQLTPALGLLPAKIAHHFYQYCDRNGNLL